MQVCKNNHFLSVLEFRFTQTPVLLGLPLLSLHGCFEVLGSCPVPKWPSVIEPHRLPWRHPPSRCMWRLRLQPPRCFYNLLRAPGSPGSIITLPLASPFTSPSFGFLSCEMGMEDSTVPFGAVHHPTHPSPACCIPPPNSAQDEALDSDTHRVLLPPLLFLPPSAKGSRLLLWIEAPSFFLFPP